MHPVGRAGSIARQATRPPDLRRVAAVREGRSVWDAQRTACYIHQLRSEDDRDRARARNNSPSRFQAPSGAGSTKRSGEDTGAARGSVRRLRFNETLSLFVGVLLPWPCFFFVERVGSAPLAAVRTGSPARDHDRRVQRLAGPAVSRKKGRSRFGRGLSGRPPVDRGVAAVSPTADRREVESMSTSTARNRRRLVVNGNRRPL